MPFKTKYKTTSLSKVDKALLEYLKTLPQNLQDKIVVTASSDGKHGEKSRHYKNKALDLRYNDEIWKYIEKDPNRHKAGITLIPPDHGSKKHIHISVGSGGENNMDVDMAGKKGYVSGTPAGTPTEPFVELKTPIVDYGIGNVDIERYNKSLTPNTIQSQGNNIDYSIWNQYGWMDGKTFLDEKNEKKTKQKKEETEFDQLLDKIENPTLKSALKLAYQTEEKKNNGSWLDDDEKKDDWLDDDDDTTDEDDYTESTTTEPTSTTTSGGGGYASPSAYSSDGSWSQKFAKAEDANRQFDHENGAWGSFGYRKSGHLGEAYKTPEFANIRQKYGSYDNFWNEFTKEKKYNDLSNEVDGLYEGWLRAKSGNDIGKAASINYTGSVQDDAYIPKGNTSTVGEYKRRMGLENGGKIDNNWLDMINNSGYTKGAKTANNPINIIPSNQITMRNVDYPIQGTDNTGVTKVMQPGKDYTFPGDIVVEKPIKKWLNSLG